MYSKNQQLLGYIIKNNPKASVTSLMKLCYLIDLVALKQKKNQISRYKYKRYHFGPFDNQIYKDLERLLSGKVIIGETDYTPEGKEFIIFKFNEGKEDFNFGNLNTKECSVIDNIINNLRGYGAKALTDIAYKTKPMEALGATQGGDENLNKELNLNLVLSAD